VSAVEDKIKSEGISFNEALLEVHQGFGNKTTVGYTNIIDFEKALFVDDKGFKAFTRNKQKTIAKKNRMRFWSIFKQMIMSSKFLLEYGLYILLVLIAYQYKPKAALMISLIALVLPELLKLKYVFKKGVRYSLSASMVGGISSAILCLQSGLVNFYKDEFTFNDVVDYRYVICFYILLYSLFRANYNLYKEVLSTTINRYNLLMS
jgi:hypothetical protein